MPVQTAILIRCGLLCLYVLLTGCGSTSALQKKWIRELGLDAAQLKTLQLYTSKKIVFRAVSSRQEEQIRSLESGQVTFENIVRREYRELIVEKGTPGICVAAQDRWLKVDFGKGIVLTFETDPGVNLYFLRTRTIEVEDVRYVRKTLNAPYLLADVEIARKTEHSRERVRAPGKKVDEP